MYLLSNMAILGIYLKIQGGKRKVMGKEEVSTSRVVFRDESCWVFSLFLPHSLPPENRPCTKRKVVYQAPFFGGKLAVRFGETKTAINEILNGSIQLFWDL